jgi:FtsH-binding integral membrane protein
MRKEREMNNSSNGNSGIGFFGMLTVAFIVMKLTGYVAWSWWWVLSPMWIPLLLVLFIATIVLIFTGSNLNG